MPASVVSGPLPIGIPAQIADLKAFSSGQQVRVGHKAQEARASLRWAGAVFDKVTKSCRLEVSTSVLAVRIQSFPPPSPRFSRSLQITRK